MKSFLAACEPALRIAAQALARGLRGAITWLSFPRNACIAALAAAFGISLLSWAVADDRAEVALFFPAAPAASGSISLRAELRDLPRPRGAEARAELVASELLLGPRDSALREAFPRGTRLKAAIYRKGRIYIDLSEDAALAEPASLQAGLAALRRSLSAAFPGSRSLTVTIGGREPYIDGLGAGNGAKKPKIN